MEISSIAEIIRHKNRIEAEILIRDKTRNAYLGRQRALCVVLGKYKMFVDTTDVGFSPHMLLDGYWEYWLTKFMVDTIKEGDVACDIGANLGYYSILMSELVGASGMVYAFEPNPPIYEMLRSTMTLNGFDSRASLVNCALVDMPGEGEIDLFVPTTDPKNASIVPAGFEHPTGATFKVRRRNINDFGLQKLDFVKIDIEGAELGVLKSLQRLKQAHQPKIVAEVNFARSYSYEEIVALLGYGGELLHIDFSSDVVPLTRKMVEDQRPKEDWLIYWPGRTPSPVR